jgi:hypothetical protein
MKTLQVKRVRWEPTEEQLSILRAMLSQGHSPKEIGKALGGLSPTPIKRVMDEHGLKYTKRKHSSLRHVDPTPEEIAERSAKIREGHIAKRMSESCLYPSDERPGNPKVCKVVLDRSHINECLE